METVIYLYIYLTDFGSRSDITQVSRPVVSSMNSKDAPYLLIKFRENVIDVFNSGMTSPTDTGLAL